MVKGTADEIQDPLYKALALEVNHLTGFATRWINFLAATRVESLPTKLRWSR